MSNKNETEARIVKSIALSKQTWDKLKEQADASHRSVTGQIAFLLESAVWDKVDG